MTVVVEALHGRVLDCAVHSLDLAVSPRMIGLGQPVLDPVRLTDHVEAHGPGVDGVAVPGLLCELYTVVGENCVDLVGHGFEHVLQELPGRLSISRCNELSNSELGCPVNADEQVKLPFGGLHLGDVDVKEPDGVALELLPSGLVSLDIRKARNAMTLKAPVQR